MLKNYLLIALRNFQRNTVYSFINVAGLAIGLACSILILLWIADEVSYDKFHTNHERIHLVYGNQEINGKVETSITSPFPLMDAIQTKSSQVEHAALINHGEGYLLSAGDSKVTKMGTMATEEFLEMFSFKPLAGNVKTALTDPTSIVLTRSAAIALFGTEDALGKLLKIENRDELKVSAVLEDVPVNSSLKFDFLIPASYYESTQGWFRRARSDWQNHSFTLFIQLREGANVADVNQAIEPLEREHSPKAPTASLFLHSLEDWRLYSEFSNGKVSGGMIEYVRMFSAIAVLILVVACINFMNLATARSERRAREVGIRKSIGSRRKQLIAQFLGESLLITIIAFVFAIVIVEVSMPFYNSIVEKTLTLNYGDITLWLYAIGLILLTGLASGSYPAFFLSGFEPVKVLKGKFQAGRGSVAPRKVFVTLQFAFSIFLIIATMIIYQQIMHVKARHVGYDRENLMLIWTSAEREKNFETIRQKLVSAGVAKSVAKSSAPITRIFSTTDGISWPGKADDQRVSFTTIATEYDFVETMGIKMLEGRDFSRAFTSDTSAVIINKAALDLMGFKDPIGHTINIWGDDRTVIGVMEDIIMGSPYHLVDPLAVVMIPDWSSTISIRLQPTRDLQGSISTVEKIFKEIDPEHPLWHRFADTEFETKFRSINLVSQLAWIFAILAIVISSMGLFGLAAFTAEQRTKELGIRKILGAKISTLVLLISRDFSRLVVVAFVIAAPVTWWLVDNFLQRYPYRVSMQWWVVLSAGAGVLILTLLIVTAQALRAARTNPVDSLRSE
jgi:predicted permease